MWERIFALDGSVKTKFLCENFRINRPEKPYFRAFPAVFYVLLKRSLVDAMQSTKP